MVGNYAHFTTSACLLQVLDEGVCHCLSRCVHIYCHVHASKQQCWSGSNQTVTDSAAPSHRPIVRKKTALLGIAISSKWPSLSPPFLTSPPGERLTPCLDTALLKLGSACPALTSVLERWGHITVLEEGSGGGRRKAWRMLNLNSTLSLRDACCESIGNFPFLKSLHQQPCVFPLLWCPITIKGHRGSELFALRIQLEFKGNITYGWKMARQSLALSR